MSFPTSPINLQLPLEPDVPDRKLREQFQLLYDAVRILQTELDEANARIAVLEQYNIDFP